MAKLVGRPLATRQHSGFKSSHPSKIVNGQHVRRSGRHTVVPPKKKKKNVPVLIKKRIQPSLRRTNKKIAPLDRRWPKWSVSYPRKEGSLKKLSGVSLSIGKKNLRIGVKNHKRSTCVYEKGENDLQ